MPHISRANQDLPAKANPKSNVFTSQLFFQSSPYAATNF